MRVAIIGSGISGLCAARRLSDHHDVTVFEAAPTIGGHTNTIDVEVEGERHAIDTGFIVYNETNYPHFSALLADLGVESQSTSMSFSVRCESIDFEYKGEARKNGRGILWSGLFAQKRNLLRPRFWSLMRDIVRFGRIAGQARTLADQECTVSEFCRAHGLGSAFLDLYLVPLGASLWSCPPETFRQFPMRFVADFLSNHAMLEIGERPIWRVIRGGSRQYLAPLVAPFADRIRVSTPVKAVRRTEEGVIVETAASREVFDHAVLACHADTALKLLDDPLPVETELLTAFPYQVNEAILHTDTRILPRREQAWASWNYHLTDADATAGVVTYDMNILQSLESSTTFCVTLNDGGRVDPDRVLRRIRYEHPLYTARRQEAQARREEMIGLRGLSYCGAYWGYGFHEDGVRSGFEVAARIGEEASCPARS